MDFTPVAAATTHTVYSDNLTRPVNGSVKKKPPATAPQCPSMVVSSSSYKECLKNHAASIGGHALDGCGEFIPSLSSNPADPRSLKCAACGCHRNFHRRDPQQEQPQFLNCFYSSPPPPAIPHRIFSPSTSPSPSPSPSTSPMSSPSPPPLSHFPPPQSSFHSAGVSVPHMILAIGTSYSAKSGEHHHRSFNSPATMVKENPTGKKRCRTTFSPEQKRKMYAFSERLGWKMQKVDDGLIQEFCNEIGVSRVAFKVWMHNHKNTFRTKRSESENNNNKDEDNSDNNNGGGGGGGLSSDIDKDSVVNRTIDLHASSVNGSSSS